jgi:hypothetical protein
MQSIIRYINRSTLTFSAVFATALGALAYPPSSATAQSQVKCYVCACEGGRCICEEVKCPPTQPAPPPEG